MTGMLIEFALSAILAVLLAVTIYYCWLLNKRIQLLQNSRSELAALLKHFDKSTTKATNSIAALQAAGKQITESVQARIDKASFLIDDLNLIMERADKVADELQHLTSPANRRTAPPPVPKQAAHEPTERSAAVASLEAMIKRVSERPESPPARKKASEPESDRIPSRVEKELLEILKTHKV